MDKRIVLSNSQFGRLLPFSTWNSLRIGVRWHMRNTGGAIGAGGRLAVGLCRNTTAMFGDATTDHFVGWVTDGSWGFTTPNQYHTIGGKPATRIGASLTLGTVFAAGNNIPADAGGSNNDRKIFFVDITKGSPNYSLALFAWSSGVIDVTNNQFLLKMEETAPSLSSHAAVSAQTIAVDTGANGVFNAVNISWGRSTPEVEICDLAIARLS